MCCLHSAGEVYRISFKRLVLLVYSSSCVICGGAGVEPLTVSSHLGQDGEYYLVDFARVRMQGEGLKRSVTQLQ